ncbi:MAG: CoA-binding protein, partial [Anaerolineales bacterium]
MTFVDTYHATDADKRRILEETRTIAVVGFSHRETRAGYRIPAYMHRVGYRIIPVNPYIHAALGEPAYPELGAIPDAVDLVNVFRRSEQVPDVVEQSIEIGA